MAKVTMTVNQLIALFMGFRGAAPATIVTATEPKMRKTGNPYYGRVTKLATANVFVNFIYGNAVNRQRLREGGAGDFRPEPRAWGERIEGTGLVRHVKAGEGITRYYLEVRYLDSGAKVSYILDLGSRSERPIELAEFAEFVPDRASSAEHQGVRKEIVMRDVEVRNIVSLRFNGDDITVLR
jgi:hypothetical protein